MENWITDFLEQFGYLGVFLLICAENLFPPIPSEVILTFSGFMTSSTTLSVAGVIIYSTLGSVLGAILLYGIGMLFGIERMERFIQKYGSILRVKVTDIHRADRWFDKYGYWTVLFCRMIPLVRSLISIPAGMTRMNFPLFLIFTTVGTVIWNTFLVTLGAKVGESWEDIVHYMDIYSNIVYLLLFIVIVFCVVYFWRRKRK